MGGSISKVSCSEITYNHHKKYKRSVRRHHVRIDKTKIGIPTDFRHTYHVGNNSPIDESLDAVSINRPASVASDPNFEATMAQIADALQKLPLHASSAHYTPRVSPKKMSNSRSDQYIIPRRTFSLLGTKNVMPNIELSSSMIIQSTKEKNFDLSEKESTSIELPKTPSIQSLQSDEEKSPPLSPSYSLSEESESSPQKSFRESFLNVGSVGNVHGFSSCLQSKIDAQIVELARVRSKHVKNSKTSKDDNLTLDKPTLMI